MSDRHAPGSGRVYEPVADIARGGMGRGELVVRREGSFARVYAMKRLRPELTEDGEVRAMFLEEARIAGLIRHPNVVPVLDVGEDELGPYLVMEYIEGVAAHVPMAPGPGARPLPIGLCAEIIRQAAHGLAAAHELEGAGGKRLSVVHRDVSPQNILLGFDGLVRVTDFGVARALDHRADEGGSLMGKIGYMSPEQVGRRPLDARSDLFSLGIVLYELLTSQRLYGGDKDDALARIRLAAPPDPRAVRADVPAELAGLVSELLAKTPEARPSSASVVASRLEAIVAARRHAGEDVSLAPFLLASCGDERKRQRSLVAAALERTQAEISLYDQPGTPQPEGYGTTIRPARAPTPAEVGGVTVREPPRPAPAAATVPAERSRSPASPLPRWAALALGAAMLVGLGVWATRFFGEAPAANEPVGPLAHDGCIDSSECRATQGAVFFCDLVTHRCESALSAVCPEIFPADAGADPDAIVLGTIFDRSSPNQSARERAARLAVQGLDHVGGIDGRRVVLIHCDSSVEGAAAAADQLVRANVPAIIGPSTSAETEAVFSSHAADGVLVISPSATATQLGDIDRSAPGLLWRTAPPDSLQATVILDELRIAPAARSIVVVRASNDVYAQSLSVLLQEAAATAGLSVSGSQLFGRTDEIASTAEAAIASAPDAVVFLSSRLDDAVTFLDATSALSAYDGITIYLPDVAANDDLLARTGPGASRFSQVRATRPAPPHTIITSEFVSEYASANGGEDPLAFSFTAHTYDAATLVLLGTGFALGDGGELTGARIAQGIRLASRGSREHRLLGANLPATIAALRVPSPDVDVVGASGALDYDPATEELTTATYEVLEIRGAPPRLEVLRTAVARR